MEFEPFDTGLIDFAISGTLLVMARFTGYFAVSPFFSKRAMGRSVRLGFILAAAFICAPPVVMELHSTPELGRNLHTLVIKEFILGFLLGVLTWLPVRGLEFAGVVLDTQRGSTQAQDYDVIFAAQTTPTAILLAQTFSAYFFTSGGLLMVLTMLFESTRIWPPAAPFPEISANSSALLIQFAGILFVTALAVAMPISGFMIIADIVIAFLARSAQSLNALTFGMPVKSGIMLILLFFYLEIVYPKIMMTFGETLAMMSKVLVP
ncbi:EscT/YscT/HrcT family type III secretion system export apparatus protein [Leisingera sp. S232]|uniref:EscT/YscT/HrcT family type III secretion system export apparatus protein n=1 Tax=Leisingera sp. S232 TaxID=3415132 RepID=UPI003C7A3DAD